MSADSSIRQGKFPLGVWWNFEFDNWIIFEYIEDSNGDNPGNKAMHWPDAHATPGIHSTIEDDALEITDGSAAVPHDLLSSAPGSEDDNNL